MIRSLAPFVSLLTFFCLTPAQGYQIDFNSIEVENERACDPYQESLLIHKKTVGVIKAPSPGRSWQNRTCKWTLLAPEGHQVWLKVTELKLDKELIGKLEVYDGHSRNERLIEEFVGTKQSIPFSSSPIISPRNVIHIHYSGVVIRSKKPSFQIEYMFLKRPKDCSVNTFKCRHNSNDEYGPFFHFQNQCYRKDQICDGIDDCGDGTDEQSCTFDGIPTAPKPIQAMNCGQPRIAIRQSRLRPKIKGGLPAIKGSWPWMASIYQGNMGPVKGLACGAVLINELWLLSAAHCFIPTFSMDPKWTINLGFDRKYSTNCSKESVRYIDEIIFPEGWDSMSGRNDIALIKMNAPIPNGNYNIAPICLPNSNEKPVPRSRALIAGWGDANEHFLKQGNVPIWDQESCQVRYKENGTNPHVTFDDTLICAGKANGGDETCYGDSGGPLIAYDTDANRWNVIGITSQGYDDDCEEGPGLYTSVPAFIPWINEVMNHHQ